MQALFLAEGPTGLGVFCTGGWTVLRSLLGVVHLMQEADSEGARQKSKNFL